MNGTVDALALCGVTESTLAPAQKEALDREGYLLLPGVVDPAWLERLRETFESAMNRAGPGSGGKRSGTRHADDLAWAGEPPKDVPGRWGPAARYLLGL